MAVNESVNGWMASMSLVISLTAAARAEVGVVYVASEGNDAWSGTLRAPNARGTDGPFRSLERARDEIRKRKAAGGLPAGEMVVEVYDLAREESGRQVSRWAFSVNETAGLWLSGFGTNHFKMVLPWSEETAPRHAALTVVARFTDALTGKTHEAQKVIDVTVAVVE